MRDAWEEGWALPFDVVEALHRQLSHYAYHTGQIVFLAKHLCGPAWRTLSIPRGQSAAFNAAPHPYLGRPAQEDREG